MDIHRPNAWLIKTDSGNARDSFSVLINGKVPNFAAMRVGDGLVIVQEDSDRALAFSRIYRIRSVSSGLVVYFDAIYRIDPGRTLPELGITQPTPGATVTRLDWTVFENALTIAADIEFSALPLISGGSAKEKAYLRELLEMTVADDLLGPADGPYEEIVEMSVRDRYLVGRLAPRGTGLADDQREDIPDAVGQDAEGGDRETDNSTTQSLMPSSIGLTFCVDGEAEALEVEAKWGRYDRGESEKYFDEQSGKPLRAWKRTPSGGRVTLALKDRETTVVSPDPSCPRVLLRARVRPPLPNGDRLVTLFLINSQMKPEENEVEAWIFQPELIVRDAEGRPVFRRKPLLEAANSEDEREALEMIYRNRVEFAVGHGVSVHAESAEERTDRATEIRTDVLPRYEVGVTETPGWNSEDRAAMRRMVSEQLLDMKALAEMERDRLIEVLTVLTDDYGAWIGEQRSRIGEDITDYDEAASAAMDRCDQIAQRLREGVEVLRTDDRAFKAFRFANRAMAAQRVRGIYALKRRRGDKPDLAEFDKTENRSWRPFQLAFLLLSVPALAQPLHTDRTDPLQAHADLLWFPTGGGKTEAYLGVAAFTMVIRRLQGNLGGLDGSRGLSVIMRYTLRLLTLQQFQRATSLICAMEVIRRADPKTWGAEPFTIGLWVGQGVTPNTTAESNQAITAIRNGNFASASSPAQLTSCPWCGAEISAGRDIRVDTNIGKTTIYCGDPIGRCDFSHGSSHDGGLPVSVVDEEIYHRPPTMLIATVDKFAMMSWRGQVRTLFGKATRECPRHGLLWEDADCKGNHPRRGRQEAVKVRKIAPIRPPDLIIQDEFHLISGPLGTMVGLYETAVDELCSWSVADKTVRPKIVASTATVRKADKQVGNVFLRKVSIFPPHGLDVEDNFFSVQRPVEEKPGRRYLGICAPGSSRPAVLIRVYVALLTAGQALFERFGTAVDPYMTVVGYFNSLRELGGMRRLAEDDVTARAFRVERTRSPRPGLKQRNVKTIEELTSRVQSRDIPAKLDQLEAEFKATWGKNERRAVDIVLATNMLSVGVDVNRLGVMAVNGQPKNTAEYIQATSRVGRASPGLVCTVFNWARPRDLSHYETFEHYHATFYKHVEAQSVTPFSPRALDRGLTGTMISLARLGEDELNPNLGAEHMDKTSKPEVAAVKQKISDRAWLITDDKTVRDLTKAMVADRFDRWVKEATRGGRQLGYESGRDQGTVFGLLKKPGPAAWDELTVPMSMREVEPGVRLVMDESTLPPPPDWRAKIKKDEEKEGNV